MKLRIERQKAILGRRRRVGYRLGEYDDQSDTSARRYEMKWKRRWSGTRGLRGGRWRVAKAKVKVNGNDDTRLLHLVISQHDWWATSTANSPHRGFLFVSMTSRIAEYPPSAWAFHPRRPWLQSKICSDKIEYTAYSKTYSTGLGTGTQLCAVT